MESGKIKSHCLLVIYYIGQCLAWLLLLCLYLVQVCSVYMYYHNHDGLLYLLYFHTKTGHHHAEGRDSFVSFSAVYHCRRCCCCGLSLDRGVNELWGRQIYSEIDSRLFTPEGGGEESAIRLNATITIFSVNALHTFSDENTINITRKIAVTASVIWMSDAGRWPRGLVDDLASIIITN